MINMNFWEVSFRIVIVMAISVLLSIMAMRAIKLSGTDLKDFKQRERPSVLFIAGIFNLLFILAVFLLLKYIDRQPMSILGFNFCLRETIFSGLILAGMPALALIYILILRYNGKISFMTAHTKTRKIKAFIEFIPGIIVLFIAALQEEVMFRGYITFVLLPYGFYLALLVSSLLFTLWHFLTNKLSVAQVIAWFLGGIMLFYIYWLSGSIWVATLVHFSRNLTNVLIFNISGKTYFLSYRKSLLPFHKTGFVLLSSIMIIFAGLLFFR
jgi:uncharacterized protein